MAAPEAPRATLKCVGTLEWRRCFHKCLLGSFWVLLERYLSETYVFIVIFVRETYGQKALSISTTVWRNQCQRDGKIILVAA